ncbi:hypothetical protein BDN67DRAFT_912248 [Paxillus ammoniavirescens]|nr:hypothetical protein BDN67DRAFT_912248 [Paxillus ammoniavirescens]
MKLLVAKVQEARTHFRQGQSAALLHLKASWWHSKKGLRSRIGIEISRWRCPKAHAGVFRRNNTVTHRGRAIRRLVSLFDDVENLVTEYDRQSDSAAENLGEDPVEHSTQDQDRLYSSFEELLTYLPWMKRKIINCDPDELDNIFKQLRKGADGAHGDDTANLKGAVVTWLAELFHPIDPPLNPSTKEERGLVHDTTGKLICPAEYNWLLDS